MDLFSYPITLGHAQIVLRPRMPLLAEALNASWQIWRGDAFAGQRMILDDSARATIVNQNFYWNAAQLLSADKGVQFNEDNHQRFIVFDEQLIVRFKFLDGKLEARNYPTTRAREWVRQAPLPGIPELARLHFGYRVDAMGLRIDDAFVTLPTGIATAANAWIWQVWGSPLDFSTFAIQLPFPSKPGQQTTVYDHEDYSSLCGR